MRAVRVSEKDVKNYLFRKRNYLIVSEEVKAEEVLILVSEEGTYRCHVTDALAPRIYGSIPFSILTVDNFEVLN